jgi:hypothetical protein
VSYIDRASTQRAVAFIAESKNRLRNAAINLLRLADIAAKIPVNARSIAPKLRRFARHPRRLFAFLSIVKK